jgi:hypothetical protein
MKVNDRSEFRDEEGAISLENRIQGTIQHGLGWYGMMQAQEFVTQRLEKNLDKEHTLLLNVHIPNTMLIVPLILLSPQGVKVIEPSPVRGVFRAKGEEWLKFDGRGRRFKRTQPNLQSRVVQMAKVVHLYLQDQGYAMPDVEAVLVFINPRTHVDQTSARARIVQADAIEHFAANLKQAHQIMDQEDIRALTEVLINPPEPEPVPEEAFRVEAFDLRPEPAPVRVSEEIDRFVAEPEPLAARDIIASWSDRLPLSKRQWILLGTMAFFEIVILIILTMLVIANTFYT